MSSGQGSGELGTDRAAGGGGPRKGDGKRNGESTQNPEPRTGSRQPATGNRQPGTGNWEPGTGNRELTGQTAVVTGGSRGIGKGIARVLAEAGARVIVLARSAVPAQSAAAELPGEGHAGFACDVADGAAVDAAIRQIETELAPIDVLVNNAGVTDDNIVVRLSDEAWDRVLATNLKGAFHTIRAVARGMMRRRAGRIINIASVVGVSGNRGQANYVAAKAGLIGLTKTVAKELASRGVLCNAVAPGFIETEMTASLPAEARDKLLEQIALGRLGTAEDVAGVVRFLAGPDSTYITGQVIVVDGGMVV